MKAWWLALLLLVGCATARQKVRSDVVRRIHFDGNGTLFSGHNDYQLRTQMEQDASTFGLMTLPMSLLVEPKLLDRDALTRDAYRLEVFYAHNGWFDARFAGWAFDRVRRQTPGRASVLDIRGRIDPGVRSLIRTIDVEGAEALAPDFVRGTLRKTGLREEDPYSLELVRATRAELENRLQREGFAYAKVTSTMDAFPEVQAVDVHFKVETGIPTTFGAIDIQSSGKVPILFIRDALRLEEGGVYGVNQLLDAQNRVFALRTFSLVTVLPDLSDPTRSDVPITVRVTESGFRTLRFGLGLRAEAATNWQPYVSSRFTHDNVFNQLIRFSTTARFGVANYSPLPSVQSDPQPVWSVKGSFLYPRLFHQRMAQNLEVDVGQTSEELQQVFSVEVDTRTVFRPTPWLALSAGPHYEFVNYIGLQPGSDELARAQAVYGDDFEESYRITSVDVGATVDRRDDRIRTKRGGLASVNGRFAFPLTDQDYGFIAVTSDLRMFHPIRLGKRAPFTWASRLHGRLVQSLTDRGVPYRERAFFGGASDMRGFPHRGMGPYQLVPETDELPALFVPRGGTLGGVLSQEIRYYGTFGLVYAAFADLALQGTPADRDPDWFQNGFRFAAGVGVRYDSSIGPIRFDIAVRPKYNEDCGPYTTSDTGALIPATVCGTGRRMDIVRALKADSDLPAIMFFLAFGEAL